MHIIEIINGCTEVKNNTISTGSKQTTVRKHMPSRNSVRQESKELHTIIEEGTESKELRVVIEEGTLTFFPYWEQERCFLYDSLWSLCCLGDLQICFKPSISLLGARMPLPTISL